MSEQDGTHQWNRFEKNAQGKDAQGTAKRQRAQFKVQQEQTEASGGGFLLTTVLIVGVLAGLVVAVQYYRSTRPDPHFTAAVTMIQDFEQGKTLDRINYGHEVYKTALERLAQVDPKSVSAMDAQALDRTIRDRIAEFQVRLREEEERTEAVLTARRKKEEIVYQRVREARAHPPRDYPECEDGHSGHDHSH